MESSITYLKWISSILRGSPGQGYLVGYNRTHFCWASVVVSRILSKCNWKNIEDRIQDSLYNFRIKHRIFPDIQYPNAPSIPSKFIILHKLLSDNVNSIRMSRSCLQYWLSYTLESSGGNVEISLGLRI